MPESPLLNRRIAFVGKLGGVNRHEAKDIVQRLGGTLLARPDPSVDWIVIGADVLPMGEPESLRQSWVTQGVQNQSIDVIDETEFWRRLGVVEAEEDRNLYTPAMLAQLLEVPIATIRRWQRQGLIVPCRKVKKLPYFDFQEVALAKRIAELIREGTRPETIEKRLIQLASRYPHLSRPLCQLSIVVEGKEILVRHGDELIEPNGQRRLGFDTSPRGLDEPAGPVAIPFDRSSAEVIDPGVGGEIVSKQDFLQLAFHLEDEQQVENAIEVYRSLMLAHGPTPDVCFRMAELLYQSNDCAGARERYSMAIELDESFVEARANLGCVLVELDKPELAKAAFEGALKHHEAYPDVHFHMARLLDELKQSDLAAKHWNRFLELAPHSPWSSEARERLQPSN